LVFVVDATDVERIDEAKDILHATTRNNKFPPTVPVLVLANKQDVPGAMSATRLMRRLELTSLTKRFHIMVRVSSILVHNRTPLIFGTWYRRRQFSQGRAWTRY
jgi:signal recognition particle receptor subunit beta